MQLVDILDGSQRVLFVLEREHVLSMERWTRSQMLVIVFLSVMSPKNDASNWNNKACRQIESLAERKIASQTEITDLGFSLQLSLVLGE